MFVGVSSGLLLLVLPEDDVLWEEVWPKVAAVSGDWWLVLEEREREH